MFWLAAILYVAIDIYSLSHMKTISYSLWELLAQSQVTIVCWCGLMASVNTSPKRKSLMFIIAFASLIVLIMRFIWNTAPGMAYWIIIALYISGLVWAGARPYHFISDTHNHENICLLFYKSDKGSWLMHIMSLFGLPVSSMSVLCGEYWLKLIRSDPNMQIQIIQNRDLRRYVLIDTGVKITDEIENAMWSLDGVPATNVKSLFLRVRCIAAIKPLISKLGNEWVPKTIIQQIPSIYFYKALKNRQSGI